jgi:hypothetical protein
MKPIDHIRNEQQINQNEEKIRALLRQSLPPIGDVAEPPRDLWPAMLKRLDEKPAAVPWLDWALLAGLLGVVAFVPASIPVLLYYL